ncbi:ATP-binding protein [Bailinhaonella thermotolerans]|uniref:ATP-binding protein n=1 Tax=Bailinhaonella thermotolerans TaxID=1070861 RepID=UPI00192A391A|nr:ATP-binding protein [Bailinhaonella thermotolerans]
MNDLPELRRPLTKDPAVLRRLRRDVRQYAARAGLAGLPLRNLLFAVNEAVTNVVLHGGARGVLVVRADADAVHVEVIDDSGALSHRHLTRAPDPGHGPGWGLWLIRQVCDEVRLDHPGGHTRLRLLLQR